MAWLKIGDNAATYPPLMSIAGMPGADMRTVNEVFGFMVRLAIQSAAHMTDYVVDVGTVYMAGASETDRLLDYACRAKLLSQITTDGLISYRIVADPEFIHMRSRAEILWERQQRKDTRDDHLIVPVLLRDGDNCRWCGTSVVWRGRKSKSSGEFDHLNPGEAGTVETMVVACRSCNAQRGADPKAWASRSTLLPVPKKPRYGEATAEKLQNNGYPSIVANIAADETAAPQAAAKPQRREAPIEREAIMTPETPAEIELNGNSKSISRSVKTDYAGSGRDGNGRDGSGLDGTGGDRTGNTGTPPPAWAGATWPSEETAPAPKPQHTKKRRRGKRGGRKR